MCELFKVGRHWRQPFLRNFSAISLLILKVRVEFRLPTAVDVSSLLEGLGYSIANLWVNLRRTRDRGGACPPREVGNPERVDGPLCHV